MIRPHASARRPAAIAAAAPARLAATGRGAAPHLPLALMATHWMAAAAAALLLLLLLGAGAQAASPQATDRHPGAMPEAAAPPAMPQGTAWPARMATAPGMADAVPMVTPAPVQPVITTPTLGAPGTTWQPGAIAPGSAVPPPVNAANGPPIVLTKGQLRALNFNEPVTRIIVTDGAVLDASVLSERQVRLAGLKNGRTYVTVTTAGNTPVTYAVAVVPDLSGVQSMLARDPLLRGLRLSADDDHIVASGYLGSPQAHAHAMDVLHAYYGEQVIDMTQTGGGQVVAVEIKFAAVQANTLKELGLNLTSLHSGFSFVTAGPSALSNIALQAKSLTVNNALPLGDAFNLLFASPNSGLIGAISALSDTSMASILAEPTLLVRSGDVASFLAGGEVPIPVPQTGSGGGSTITVAYHEYGVKLNIAPQILADGRIAMTVNPEVSSIDTANQLSIFGYSVPAFLKRTTSTTVELADGQSFMLAGLLYSTTNIDEQKLPGLGDLPIIGAFFRYSKNARDKQELIIIATPHIVQPIPAGAAVPPAPGAELQRDYDPSVADMLLNRKPADAAARRYGLMR